MVKYWAVMIGAILMTFATWTAQAADLVIRLDAREVVRKRIHTELTLAVAPGPLTLVFPKWIPGEHAPSGPLQSMIGLSIRANDADIEWTRDPFDIYAFKLTVPPGVNQIAISLDTGLPTPGSSFSAGPTSSEQLAVLSWNQFVLLPQGRDAEQISTSASIRVPSNWNIASSLDARPAGDGAYAFEEASLTRLIDSPLQIGRYTRLIELPGSAPAPQIAHTMAIAADSMAALKLPEDFASGYGRMVAEAGALFGSRMYRHYTFLVTLSDYTGWFGLEHHESSDDRFPEMSLMDAELRPWSALLLGHEYVHSWNGKYRRPQGMLSPDYDQPMDGSLLWVYEGLTTFWGQVLPTRASLLSQEQFREYLAQEAAIFDNEPGADWRPLADTAVAAQNLYSAPEGWSSSRRMWDFYEASVFLWLDVDAEIRALTQGQMSLDDFMQSFYAGTSGEPALRPYVEQDVYNSLSALVPGDWQALIRSHLDEKGTATLFASLENTGWRLSYSGEKNLWEEYVQKQTKITDRMWSIGMRLDKDALIADVVEDRAAARAGAGPGMTLVAVNGRKFSAEMLDTAIEQAKLVHEPIELLVLNDDFYRILKVEYFDGPRFPHLTRIEGATDGLAAVLRPRVTAR